MHDKQSDHHPALTELRRRLNGGLARARLDKTQLATRAHLGRTTVSEAFGANGRVPSEKTVAALARALKLPVQELLELQRTAAASDAESGPGPGKPIGEWEPHALEVHPAGPGSGSPEQRALPGYVPREHDQVLAEAVREAGEGHSRMLVLVGTSSTGKTRACWEAVQTLAEKGWRLWHPFDPTRAEAALDDLHRVRPRTVVWLNEAQHYFGATRTGERIAAAVHSLLVQPERGPVLVLGTLWPEYAAQYTALPTPDGPDPHSRVRELLTGRTLTVPDTFDAPALAAANVLAEGGDRLLADALNRASADGRLTQDLAGAPELLHRYQSGTPAAKAVLEAAMDTRRLGVGLHLPQAFLTDAALDYLSDIDYDQLTDDWAEAAFAELAQLVHGKQAPLRRVNPRPQRRTPGTPPIATPSHPTAGPVFRLADYLEQHGRTTRRRLCPPASFWAAAYTHLADPGDLHILAEAAKSRCRNRWAHRLHCRAAEAGNPRALIDLAGELKGTGNLDSAQSYYKKAAETGDARALAKWVAFRAEAGDWDAAKSLARKAAAGSGSIEALVKLAKMRTADGALDGAELACEAADAGAKLSDLLHLASALERAGNLDAAESLYRKAADAYDADPIVLAYSHGARKPIPVDPQVRRLVEGIRQHPLVRLTKMFEKAGNQEAVESLAREVADKRNANAMAALAKLHVAAGDLDGAESLAHKAARTGNAEGLAVLALGLAQAGHWKTAESLAREATHAGNLYALYDLAMLRATRDLHAAEPLARQAAEAGNPYALLELARFWDLDGNLDTADSLCREAAKAGAQGALVSLAEMWQLAGNPDVAESLYRQAAKAGDIIALNKWAVLRAMTGDWEAAKSLALEAAEADHAETLLEVAELLKQAGDQQAAESLWRQVADAGGRSWRTDQWFADRWPHGLEPDGTPTPPWH